MMVDVTASLAGSVASGYPDPRLRGRRLRVGWVMIVNGGAARHSALGAGKDLVAASARVDTQRCAFLGAGHAR
jgi:hypothetical protein